MIHLGDNLEIMRGMASGSIDLIATDPPYNTGRDFGAYNDRWAKRECARDYGDICSQSEGAKAVIVAAKQAHSQSMGHFLTFMGVRLLEMRRVLKLTGSIYLQCDPAANSYLRMMMDAIFGANYFRNEIIWLRKRNGQNAGGTKFASVTDSILFYMMDKDSYWQPQYGNYDPEYLKAKYCYDDGDGRGAYSLVCLSTVDHAEYEFRGKVCQWKWTKARVQAAWDAGELIQREWGGPIYYKKYLSSAKGVPLRSLWDDIAPVKPQGYPTRKPVELYERIIGASCPVGGLVFDPFCGSGTTMVAAKRLGRQYAGCDRSGKAVYIANERIESCLI